MIPRLPARKIVLILFIAIIIFAGSFSYDVQKVNAALITSSSVQPSSSIPSASNATYVTTFTFPDPTTLECIQVKFATAPSMGTAATGMTAGSGFTLSGGGLTQANWTNYGSTNGTLEIFAATAQTPTLTAATVNWTGVTNTSITNPTPIYAQITTYSTESSSGATCSGQVDQSNIMALLFTSGVVTQVSVDPALTLTVANYGSAVNSSGDTITATTSATSIPFGTVDGGSVGAASQTLTVGTNAAHGYNLYINKTQTLIDANSDTYRDQGNLLSAPASFDGSAAQSSFALTDDSTNKSLGSNKWGKIQNVTNSDAIDDATTPVAAQIVHTEFKVETGNTQAPGTYTTTVIYTAAPSY
jgi:hypothetical protein